MDFLWLFGSEGDRMYALQDGYCGNSDVMGTQVPHRHPALMKLFEIQTFSHTSTKPVSNYDLLNLKKQQTNRKTTTKNPSNNSNEAE